MSTIHRFLGDTTTQDYTWEGVEPLEIHTEEVRQVLKHVLVGPDDGAPNFVIRYFHVPIGDNTFYDKHPHEHGIVILHGKARVQINQSMNWVRWMPSLLQAMISISSSTSVIHRWVSCV